MVAVRSPESLVAGITSLLILLALVRLVLGGAAVPPLLLVRLRPIAVVLFHLLGAGDHGLEPAFPHERRLRQWQLQRVQ